MRNNIEFATSDAPKIPTVGDRQQTASWTDLTAKPAYRKMKVRFPEGLTLARIIPHIKGGPSSSYVEVINVVKTPGFNLITTAGDVFSRAYAWLSQNRPNVLERYEPVLDESGKPKKKPDGKTETRKVDGFTLKPSTQALSWAVYWGQNAKGGPDAANVHLGLIHTAFSGGKNPGLLASIVSQAEATETEPGATEASRVYTNSIADAEAGRNINITKTVDKSKTPQQGTTYTFAISSKEAGPLKDVLAGVSDEEFALLAPLSSVVNILSDAEQTALLKSYIGTALVAEMGL